MHDIDTRMTGRRARWLVGMALGALALSSQIQKASGLPSVGASVDYQENLVIPGNSFVAPGRVLSAGSQLSVPIYQGGAMRNAVKAAEYRVEAGQSDLRATEASIFSQVVGAYMDVIRDQAIVQLNQKNVAVLKTNLQASSDRFEIGDLTRTDVAQSQARLALAEGDLRGAEANLIRSRENYVKLVGDAPVDLQPPPALPNLPQSVEDAVAIALNNNPDIEAANQRINASRADIGAARAARMPKLSATLGGGYNNNLHSIPAGNTVAENTTKSAAAGLSLTLPIFQGGRPSAQWARTPCRSRGCVPKTVSARARSSTY